MKTAEEIISAIKIDKANLNYIAETGKINGSLLFSIKKAMHKYASQDRWVKVDKDNLPKCEVLAINEDEDILVGWLHLEDGLCVCEDEHQQLPDVTHYQIPTPPKVK